jgi:hypothetical protein
MILEVSGKGSNSGRIIQSQQGVRVRGNIHTNQELKVFMDLAVISAGESDKEVCKIRCFLSFSSVSLF